MNKLQEKLNYLLNKYEVESDATISADLKYVTVNGKKYTLLPWRNERRFVELKKMVDSKTVGQISHFKIMSLNPATVELDDLIKREIDVAEYIGGLKVTEIFQSQNGGTCSVLCLTDKKAVITLELAVTLTEDSEVIDKHEIITDRGIACDRSVDSQTPLSSIYVYGDEKEEFTDVDFELYGLSIYEISVVRQAFDIAKNVEIGEANNKISARLDNILECAEESARTFSNVIL